MGELETERKRDGGIVVVKAFAHRIFSERVALEIPTDFRGFGPRFINVAYCVFAIPDSVVSVFATFVLRTAEFRWCRRFGIL